MKKGFTLIEILGSIVIISLFVILAVPLIINQVNSKKEVVSDVEKEVLYSAALQLIESESDLYSQKYNISYCITIESLIKKGLLVEPVKDLTTGNALDNNTTIMVTFDSIGNAVYEISELNTCIAQETNAVNCTLKAEGTKGTNDWYTGNVNISFDSKDTNGAIITEYGLTDTSNLSYNSNDSMTLTTDATTKTYYGYVKTQAGLPGVCSITIKRDTQNPSCTINSSGTLGNNNWYKTDVIMNLTRTDETSGVVSYNLSKNNSVSYDGVSSLTQTTDTKEITYYGYVKDGAGNTATCSKSIKKDATSPSCNISGNGSDSSSWVQSRQVSIGCSDVTSECESGTTTKSYTAVAENESTIIKDNAGNEKTCSYNVYRIDRVKPITNAAASYRSTNTNYCHWVDLHDNLTCLLYDYTITNYASIPSGVPYARISWQTDSFGSVDKILSDTSNNNTDTGHGWYYRLSASKWRINRATWFGTCGAGISGSGVIGDRSCRDEGTSGQCGPAYYSSPC